MLDVLGQDYIRTARTFGLAERLILWRLALRNAMPTTLTVSGLSLAYLSRALLRRDRLQLAWHRAVSRRRRCSISTTRRSWGSRCSGRPSSSLSTSSSTSCRQSSTHGSGSSERQPRLPGAAPRSVPLDRDAVARVAQLAARSGSTPRRDRDHAPHLRRARSTPPGALTPRRGGVKPTSRPATWRRARSTRSAPTTSAATSSAG